MREDMFKVIVERPRGGKGWAPSSRKRLNRDGDLPPKIGVKRHVAITRAKSKFLSENLAPLKRYVGRQVGRPWNDVYAEITATLGRRDPVQQHVLQHLFQYVARDIHVGPDGQLVEYPVTTSAWTGLPWHSAYYVDPRDGVLKESRRLWKTLALKRRKHHWMFPPPDPNVRRIDESHELRRIGGIWYEIQTDEEPDALRWVFDLVERKEVPARQRHATAKRQLSRAELKAHGIANEPRH